MSTPIHKAGDWLVIRDWNLSVRQIDKVTPKLFKLGAGQSRFPTQIPINDRKIICGAPDEETAKRLRDSIAGIDGEFNRCRSIADMERSARVSAALKTRDSALAKLLAASGIETEGHDGATRHGAEHESPTRQGDAR